MRLSYVVLNMPAIQMQQIADILLLGKLPKSREAATALLVEGMTSEEGFLRLWGELSQEEQRIYAITVFEMIGDEYTVGIAKSKLLYTLETSYGLSRDSVYALQHLLQLGLLSTMQVWYSGEGYEIPDLLLPRVVTTLVTLMPIQTVDSDQVQVTTQTGSMFLHDMIRLISHVVKRPVLVTKSGVVYKRDLARLCTMMRSHDYITQNGPAEWSGIPYAIYLAFDVLRELQILRIAPGSLQVAGAALEEFLQRSPNNINEDLLTILQVRMRQGHTNVYQLLHAFVSALPADTWVPMTSAVAALLNIDLARKVTWGPSFVHFIEVMATCGFIDVGEMNGRDVIRVAKKNPSVSARPGWVIQPNLDVLVPDEAPLGVHFMIGQLAEIKQADEMSIYTLKKETILELCDKGWTIDDIEEAFASFSAVKIASAVERQIHDWVAEYDRAVLWDVLLIRFQTPVLQEAFLSHARAKRAIADVIGDQAVIIKRALEKEVREILNELGATAPTDVRMPAEDAVMVARTGRKRGSLSMSKVDDLALSRLRSRYVIDLFRKTYIQ